MSARILFADDEADIVESLVYAFRRDGFEIDAVGNGDAALETVRNEPFDLVILDVMMPGTSGIDVCRTLRAESDVPIILLSARDGEIDRVLGLELGADDYVVKPFSTAELLSRVRALLRRRELDREAGSSATRAVGGIRLDYGRHVVTVDGRHVALTGSEFKLLSLLAERPEQVFSREQIMEHLWQTPYFGAARACDVHISNLRSKVERDPGRPERILTVRGIGYKLVAV